MSMASEALKTNQTRAGETRTVAGIVNGIETLEGGGFLVRTACGSGRALLAKYGNNSLRRRGPAR